MRLKELLLDEAGRLVESIEAILILIGKVWVWRTGQWSWFSRVLLDGLKFSPEGTVESKIVVKRVQGGKCRESIVANKVYIGGSSLQEGSAGRW